MTFFDKKEYNKNYSKQRRKEKQIKKWGVDLPIEEFEEADRILKENNLTKIDFLKNAINELKNKKED